jgi:hypothetical protein
VTRPTVLLPRSPPKDKKDELESESLKDKSAGKAKRPLKRSSLDDGKAQKPAKNFSNSPKEIKKRSMPCEFPVAGETDKLVTDLADDEPNELLPPGDQNNELHEKLGADDVTGILWSCFYCKLDFKQRSSMEEHTQAEHSINLKDCVMYSLEDGASAVSLFDLEQEETSVISPAAPPSTKDDKFRCALCEFKGRRLSDLTRHFERKHDSDGNGQKQPQQRNRKRPHDNSASAQNQKKKVKSSQPALSEGSTILAKLLQNDDPNSVYKPSDCDSLKPISELRKNPKVKTKMSLKSVSRKSPNAFLVSADETSRAEIAIERKSVDERESSSEQGDDVEKFLW